MDEYSRGAQNPRPLMRDILYPEGSTVYYTHNGPNYGQQYTVVNAIRKRGRVVYDLGTGTNVQLRDVKEKYLRTPKFAQGQGVLYSGQGGYIVAEVLHFFNDTFWYSLSVEIAPTEAHGPGSEDVQEPGYQILPGSYQEEDLRLDTSSLYFASQMDPVP
ncbi:MAG: hypothetical protein M1837_004183 [Sclerophora amabilis]|nr:MAG: hypothetical protein M1837_004183 [Sclerophora amabilis]